MFKLAELVVEIGANTKAFGQALGSVKNSLSSTLTGMKSLISSAASVIFAPLSGAAHLAGEALKGALVGVAVAIGAVGAGAAYAVKQASDLNETASAVGVVFGKSAHIVTDAADKMGESLGVPKQEFMDSAMGIGLMGKAAKLTQAEAAALGVKMAKLGADTASFRNLELGEALEKIRAGLAGEAEPLRTLGVMLTEAAVKVEAVRLGLAKENDELTEGQKVMARASLITQGLADAHGDLERTQDAVANRLREVQGRIQNLAAEIGQFLLPAVRRLVGGFAEAVKAAATFVNDHKAMFEGWGAGLEKAFAVGVSAVKHWPEALEVAKEFAKEKLTNINEAFHWLLANVGPLMDRIALAIESGFRTAMINSVAIIKAGAGTMMQAIALMPNNPVMGLLKLSGVEGAMMNAIPQRNPRAFTDLKLSSNPGLSDALANFNKQHENDESDHGGKSIDEIVAEDKTRGDLDAAKDAEKAKQMKTLAGRRGLPQDSPHAEAIRKKALAAVGTTPATDPVAEAEAARKRADVWDRLKVNQKGGTFERNDESGRTSNQAWQEKFLAKTDEQTKLLQQIAKEGTMKKPLENGGRWQ